MLPASINSKNRLFIERDSKHRRITSNIGNTFRNSKWSNYSLKNTSSGDLQSYFKTLFIGFKLISILVLTYYAIIYLTGTWIFNIFSCWLFDHFETTLNLKSYWKEALPLFWHYSTRLLWDQVFNAVFGTGSVTLTQSFRDAASTSKGNLLNVATPSKSPTTCSLDEELVLYATLFNSNSGETSSLPGLSVYDVVDKGIQYDRPSLLQFEEPNQIVCYSVLTIFSPSYDPISTTKVVHHYDKVSRWVPSFDKFSGVKSAGLMGPFYLNTLNYQTLNKLNLNPELQLSTLNVTNQSNVAKILRWSYRYNLLHRKTIINSHKLTSAKKLLGPGFFDSTSTKSNIWFSDNFSRDGGADTSDMLQNLSSQWNMMYRSNLLPSSGSITGVKNFKDLRDNFNFLSYYESSFHFFIKRIHNFLNLSSNSFSSTLTLNSTVVSENAGTGTSSANDLILLATSLGRSQTLTNGVLNPFYVNTNFKKNLPKRVELSLTKDVVLPSWDYDFLTDDQLDFVFNITGVITGGLNSVKFFDTNFTRTYNYGEELVFISDKSSVSKYCDLFHALSNNDSQLLRDIYLISLLYTSKKF